MGRPIFVRKGGRYRQPRHRALKEREDQRLGKSCVWVALDRGDYRSNGGWLWLGWTGFEIVSLELDYEEFVKVGRLIYLSPMEGFALRPHLAAD